MSDTLTLWEFEDEDDWEIGCPRCLHEDGVYMPMKHGGRERTFRVVRIREDVLVGNAKPESTIEVLVEIIERPEDE